MKLVVLFSQEGSNGHRLWPLVGRLALSTVGVPVLELDVFITTVVLLR